MEGHFGATRPYDGIFLAYGVSVTSFCHFEQIVLLKKRALTVLVAEGVILNLLHRMQVFQLLLVIKVMNGGGVPILSRVRGRIIIARVSLHFGTLVVL